MGELLLKNGNVLIGDALLQKDILIKDKYISEVVDRDTDMDVPESIDVEGCSVIPGLIDLHTHYTFSEDAHLITNEEVCLNGIANCRNAIYTGITTIRDVGGIRGMDGLLKKKKALLNVPLPHLYISGQFILPTGGHSYMRGCEIDGPYEMRRAVRTQIKRGADFIKIMLTGGFSLPGEDVDSMLFSDDELREAFKEANRHNCHVVVHAHGKEAMIKASEFQPKSIEHATYLDDEVNNGLIDNNISIVPTFYVYKYLADNYHIPEIQDGAKRVLEEKTPRFLDAVKQGVKWGVGTDSGRFMPPCSLIDEIEYFVSLGFSETEAILHATKVNAEILGLNDRGEIMPGRLADIAIFKGNVTKTVSSLRQLKYLFLEGENVFCAQL